MCSKSTCVIGSLLFLTVMLFLMVDRENIWDCLIKSHTFRSIRNGAIKLKSYDFKSLMNRIWKLITKLRKQLSEAFYTYVPYITCGPGNTIVVKLPKWMKSEPKWKVFVRTFSRNLLHYILLVPRLVCKLPVISCFCPNPPCPPLPLTAQAKQYVELGKMIVVEDYDRRQKEYELEDCQAELAKAMLHGSCTGGAIHRARSRRSLRRDRSTYEWICRMRFYLRATGFILALISMLIIHLILMSPDDPLPKEEIPQLQEDVGWTCVEPQSPFPEPV